jgi:hypothetical protein
MFQNFYLFFLYLNESHRQIVSDLKQPGGEFGPPVIRADVFVRFEECLLTEITGIIVVSNHFIQKRKKSALVFLDDPFKQAAIAILDPED